MSPLMVEHTLFLSTRLKRLLSYVPQNVVDGDDQWEWENLFWYNFQKFIGRLATFRNASKRNCSNRAETEYTSDSTFNSGKIFTRRRFRVENSLYYEWKITRIGIILTLLSQWNLAPRNLESNIQFYLFNNIDNAETIFLWFIYKMKKNFFFK